MDIALAIIQRPVDGAILIAQRRGDAHLPNLWEFPGGKCLPGEMPGDCAVREVQEETGLSVRVIAALMPISHAYPERTVTLHPFFCYADDDGARPLGSRQVLWVAPKDLPQYSFPEANASLIKLLVR